MYQNRKSSSEEYDQPNQKQKLYEIDEYDENKTRILSR
jgi:hypothetical protein